MTYAEDLHEYIQTNIWIIKRMRTKVIVSTIYGVIDNYYQGSLLGFPVIIDDLNDDRRQLDLWFSKTMKLYNSRWDYYFDSESKIIINDSDLNKDICILYLVTMSDFKNRIISFSKMELFIDFSTNGVTFE